jgi:asparagine synthase (glutamine-hydrolysing)
MGVKPFFYYCSDRLFVFATEIKALLCLSEVPRQLNEIKIADHLATLFEDKASTYYKEILRLPPAHSVSVTRNGIQIKSYWTLDPAHNIRFVSDREYAEAFREVFTEAVRCRLRSAFPVGSTLSGGLDSSSIACTARNLMSQRGNGSLHTFSAIFPSLPKEDLVKIDERPYINAVLATGGFVPHYVHADRISPLAELDRVMWFADEPILAPNLYIHRALYQKAQEQGVRIFLDGIDGDTTVSHGLEYLIELARTVRWRTLFTEVTALAHNSQRSRWKILWRYGFKPLVPESVIKTWRALHGRNGSKWAGNKMVNSAFSQRIGLPARAKEQMARLGSLRTAREVHLCGLSQGLNAHGLQQLDTAASPFSLEARYPFFDRRLMEFCLALPPGQKLHLGWQRFVLRQAMEGILPPQVQWRFMKANLSPNFTRRLLDFEQKTMKDIVLKHPLSPNFTRRLLDFEQKTMKDIVLKHPDIIEKYVDIPTLRAAYGRYVSNSLQKNQDALSIYGVTTLALWLRQTAVSQHIP